MREIIKLTKSWRMLISLLVSRGNILKTYSENALQSLKAELLKDEIHDDVEHFGQYGYTSHPPAGLEAVFIFPGAVREHGICIGIGDREFRFKELKEGEVALYTDKGDSLVFRQDRTIEITTQILKITATGHVVMETPRLEVTGDIIDHSKNNDASMEFTRDQYLSHSHTILPTGKISTPTT